MGVAGRLGPSRLVRDVLPESPRVENRTGGFPAGAECAALLLSGRHDKVSDRRAPWRHVACARLGKAGPASAGMCRSRRRAGRKEPVLVRSFLVRKIPTRRACSSFRHAVGFTRHVDPAYARLPVMDAAVAIGLAFECVPDPGWLSAVVCAKPRAFAMCFCHQPARRRFCAASFVLCLCLGRMPGIQCPGSGPAGCLLFRRT